MKARETVVISRKALRYLYDVVTGRHDNILCPRPPEVEEARTALATPKPPAKRKRK